MNYCLLHRNMFLLMACVLSTITGTGQQLKDVASDLNISQYYSEQRFGTGVSCFDFDGDGWLDLHVSTAFGERDLVYKNVDGQSFAEVSEEIGLNLMGGSIASLWFDYDGDHLVDLLVMNSCHEVDSCFGKNLQLFRQGTDGIFTETTELAGLDIFTDDHLKTTKGGLTAGDLNLNGFLDIVLTHWGNGEIFVLLNEGNGHFKKYGEELGITGNQENFFQPQIWDVDYDGDLDLFVNVDADPNRLFINDHFTFSERAFPMGLHAENNEMGMAIGDYNNDGLFDLFLTNIDYLDLFGVNTGTYNVLYKGLKESERKYYYLNVADPMGVKSSGWGWGTTFMDVNNDGFQDLAATNGVDNIGDPSKFWLNQGGGSFLDISDNIGFNDQLDGYSLISLDYDQDGDLDLLQTAHPYPNQDISIRLLQNDCPTCGHFITVKPRMVGANHFAIGATVKVKAGGKDMMRLITAGTSYLAQEPAEAHFGLGTATTIDEIKIIWAGGAVSLVENVPADQIIEITDADVLHTPRFTKVEKLMDSIHLAWNHIHSYETLFEIEIAYNPHFENAIAKEVAATFHEFSFKDMLSTTTTFLRIRAKNDQLTSAWTPMVWIGQFIPGPSELRITNEDFENPVLEWNDNSTNEAAFILERSEDSTFLAVESIRLSANETRYWDVGLQIDKRYFYRVAASNDVDYLSEYSNVIEHNAIEDSTPILVGYPNPASSFINLPLEMDEVKIIDAIGKSFTLHRADEGHFDIGHLPQGVYFLAGKEGEKKEEVLRFVKID